MQRISKADAKAAGLKRYYTGAPCRNGHLSERMVVNGMCVECNRVQVKKWQEANRDKMLAYGRESYQRRSESVRDRQAGYREANRDKVRKLTADWAAANPDKASAAVNRWRAENRGSVNSGHAKRRAAKLNATPCWATTAHADAIRDIYRDAAAATRATGIQHVVDHIVPLQGASVCGLHVPWNLRVITASENCSKQNRLTD